MELIGVITNSFKYGFQIPIFQEDGKLYFQNISKEETYIDSFELCDSKIFESHITYFKRPSPISPTDFAVYILKFNGTLFCGSKPSLKSYSNLFFSHFIPTENVFFLREYLCLYKDYKHNLVKKFYKINEGEFEQEDLLEYMSLIFNTEKVKLEIFLTETKEKKIKMLQLFEVKSARSEYYRFLKNHSRTPILRISNKSKKSDNPTFYELFIN